jgi:hypothetical protein
MNQNIVDWSKVYRRVTENRDTGELIEDVRIDPRNEPKEYEYDICKNPLEDVCINLVTTFYCKEPNSEKPDVA